MFELVYPWALFTTLNYGRAYAALNRNCTLHSTVTSLSHITHTKTHVPFYILMFYRLYIIYVYVNHWGVLSRHGWIQAIMQTQFIAHQSWQWKQSVQESRLRQALCWVFDPVLWWNKACMPWLTSSLDKCWTPVWVGVCVHVKERVIIPVSHYRRNMVWNSTLIFQIGNLLHERLRAHVFESLCVHTCVCTSVCVWACMCVFHNNSGASLILLRYSVGVCVQS